MDGLWDDYWIEAAISAGAALFSAVAIRVRLWMRGQAHEDAPMLRQFVAYLLAYLTAFAAIRGLEGTPRYFVLIAAAALAFGVTVNGAAPIASESYVRSIGIALCGILVLLALYGLLTLLGIDMSRDLFA